MTDNFKPIRIFYSWQSDLKSKFNRSAIGNSLNSLSVVLGKELIIDEATRDESGSPNIPQTILEKIGRSDIFIADVTTINAGYSGRKCPNPNVVFELGYAVQVLGWSRIVLLFNSSFGDISKDLPFDFDRHRVAQYNWGEQSDNGAAKQLSLLLKQAVSSILSKNPKRPSELGGLTSEQLKHSRDSRALEWVLSELHLPTLDAHIRDLPHSYPYRSLHFFEGFRGVLQGNSLFHLYDQELYRALNDLADSWYETVRYDNFYDVNNGSTRVIFTNPGDMPRSDDKERVWNIVKDAQFSMKRNLEYVLQRIRNDFLNIDLDETNRRAWEDYHEHQRLFDENYEQD